MPRTKAKRTRRNKDAVQNVRVMDEYSSTDGAKIERILGHMQNTHSQVRVVCAETFQISTSTTGIIDSRSGPYVRATDDFVSFAAQFETYRITALRFDIYDINPASVSAAFFGTWHDEVAAGAGATFTAANVIDSPDSQVVPPGTGKLCLTWVAKGTLENEFQTVSVNGSFPFDYGGLRFAVLSGAAAAPKWQVIMKAVVDFRGRI